MKANTCVRLGALCAALVFMPLSCATNRGVDDGGSGQAADVADNMKGPLGRSKTDGPEYTSNTLIISLNDGYNEDDVYALAGKYDMEVLYIYENFNMCATKLPRDYTDAEFKTLIRKLKADPIVNDASRDVIMHLY
ncbi:MAG: hypothetical protein IJU95_00735 [Treponema sp.]|nr:hypothetical protein [Treponema sp.]